MYLNKKIVIIFMIISVVILVGAVLLANYSPLSELWVVGLGLVIGGFFVGGGYVYFLESNSE